MKLIVHIHLLAGDVDQKLVALKLIITLFFANLVTGDEHASERVLVHDLVNLPTLEVLNLMH